MTLNRQARWDRRAGFTIGTIRVVALAAALVVAAGGGSKIRAGWGLEGQAPAGLEGPVVRALAHGEQILGVVFSPDGKIVVSAGNGNGAKLKLWDVRTGALVKTLEGAWVGWRSAAFSPDGKILVAGGTGRPNAGGAGFLGAFDTATGATLWSGTEAEHFGEPFAVAFAPDGQTVAIGGRAPFRGGFGAKLGVLHIRDPRTGAIGRSIDGLDDIWGVAYSPDGKTLAAAENSSGQVTLLDPATGETRSILGATRATTLAFAPDGKTLAVGKMDGEVSLFNPTGRAPVRTLGPQPSLVLSVAFSPDGAVLASGGYDKTARVYDQATGILLRLRELPAWGNAVAFSPDGRTLAIGANPDAFLWDWKADQPAPAITPGRTGVDIPDR